MIRVKCLYIDLRTRPHHNANYYHQILSCLCNIRTENRLLLLPETIRQFDPELAIFEYDYPDPYGLQSLQQIKASFPALPILMITDYHSEALAVWAFRSGVRDYLANPVKAEELISRVECLTQVATAASADPARGNLLPMEPVKENLCPQGKPGHYKTAAALDYIEANLQEKITLGEAARRCQTSPSRFSHLFRQEHGLTFQELLLRKRIIKAQTLLRDTDKSVTEVAYTTGFGDLSHFIRMFRRYVGSPPTAYRLLEESPDPVPLCVLPESTRPTQKQSAQRPTAVCHLCENWDCACWSGVRSVEKKGLPIRR